MQNLSHRVATILMFPVLLVVWLVLTVFRLVFMGIHFVFSVIVDSVRVLVKEIPRI